MNTTICAHSLAFALAAGGSLGAMGEVPPDWLPTHREDFRGGAGNWRFSGPGSWGVEDGLLRVETAADDANAFAVLRGARLRAETGVEVQLAVRERRAAGGWSFAGVALCQDLTSFWMLALTEGPDGKRYVDFLESYAGSWQAQSQGTTALPPVGERQTGAAWVPGALYRLRLILRRQQVEAEVLGPDGQRVAGGAYGLPAGAAAVRAGFPALLARGCRADFSAVTVWAPARRPAPGALAAAVEEGPRGRVGVLIGGLPGADRSAGERLADRLRRAGFGVTALSAAQVCDPDVLDPAVLQAYVIPDCRRYPAAGGETLAGYARGGGHVVFAGGPFLDVPLWQAGGEWLTEAEADERCRQTAAEFAPFPIAPGQDLSAWHRATDNPGGAGSWEVTAEGPGGQPCLRFTTAEYQGWDGYLSPPMALFGPGHDLFLFQIQADAETPQVSVEIQEEDGSRWIATVKAATEWRREALRPEAFKYWQDSPAAGRGGPGDRLQPAQARRVNFGLSHTHSPAVKGPWHQFRIAGVGSARDPLPDVGRAPALAASLETVWPRYKTHPVREAARLVSAVSWPGLPERTPSPPETLLAAIPRVQGKGFDREQKWRYASLLRAVDAEGRERGSPAWLLLCRDLPYPGSVFLGFGADPAAFARDEAWADWLAAALDRVLNGCLLAEAGTEQFACWPGETVRCGARVCNPGRQTASADLRFTIRRAGEGAAVWERTTRVAVEPGTEAVWQDVWGPPAEPGVYRVEAALLAGEGERALDRIEHEMAILDPRPANPAEFVQVREGQFVLRGEPWYPVGVNYWPLYVSGLDAPDYWAGWLDSRFYEPDLAEEDLVRMQALGMNMVSIQAPDLRFHRNLLDFLRRCDRHGVKVNLFLGLASPLAYHEDALRTYVDTARLRENTAVFAYDTIWEPGNYVFGNQRTRWDAAWREWVAERYGSLEAAERDWGVSLPRDEKGQPASPPDRWFREDGAWRVAMAAYRRFMDDLTSSLWNRAHRGLRRIDPNHLISFRQGNTLPHDFALTGPVKHIDFISPEGYSIPNTDEGGWAAGFISRYVDFTTRGKPIFWSEFGSSVWDASRMEPDAAAFPRQAEYHERFYRMVLESGAHGTAPWWWPGGYRVGERSDFGIINPDGTPRPAAELVRTYAPRLKTPRRRPTPQVWFEFDRDAHAGGYWYAAFHAGRDAYREAVAAGRVLAIRTPGTGTTSLNAPLVAVGNRPLNGSNPPKYLNAEFNWLQVQSAAGTWVEAEDGVTIEVAPGTPVAARVCVGNTQEAAWVSEVTAGAVPGVVCLAATPASQLQGRWGLAADVPCLGDADLGEIRLAAAITAEVRVELQMQAVERAWFGEKRTFTLKPAAAAP